MLEDIEQLSCQYHQPRIGNILIFYWRNNNIYSHYLYELSAIKSAKAKQLELLKNHNGRIKPERAQTNISLIYRISYYVTRDNIINNDDILISLKIHAINN